MDLNSQIQSALHPQGPHAEQVAALSWVLFIGAAAIFVVVLGLTAYALLAPQPRRAWLSRKAIVIGGGILFPIVTLTALLVYAFMAAASIVDDSEPAALQIEVVSEQWWWRVHYLDAAGRASFTTANEIRIPAGQPVDLVLRSADVIHSFWVPNLAGKLDMIPGRTHRLRIQADRAGVFRGQCAEYCGGPHAPMAFYVVAEKARAFAAWIEGQQRPAAQPASDFLAQGRALFLTRGCEVCHTVRGTPAQGTRGPDLTHLGSRISIGAGTLPNNPGTLEVFDPLLAVEATGPADHRDILPQPHSSRTSAR